jgi:hypothetical protein
VGVGSKWTFQGSQQLETLMASGPVKANVNPRNRRGRLSVKDLNLVK